MILKGNAIIKTLIVVALFAFIEILSSIYFNMLGFMSIEASERQDLGTKERKVQLDTVCKRYTDVTASKSCY